MLVDPVQWGFGIVWIVVAVAAYLDARQRDVDNPRRVGLAVFFFGGLGALWYLWKLRPDDDTHSRTRDNSTVTLPSAAEDRHARTRDSSTVTLPSATDDDSSRSE